MGGVAKIAPHLNQHSGPKFGMGGRGPWPLARADWVASCSLTCIVCVIGHDPCFSVTEPGGVASYPHGYRIWTHGTKHVVQFLYRDYAVLCYTSHKPPHHMHVMSHLIFNALLVLKATVCAVQKDFINFLPRPQFHNGNSA